MTHKMRLFAAFYVGKAAGNATEAARLAGYADAKGEGHRLSHDAEVRALIEAQVERAAMQADEVLARLSAIADADYSLVADCMVEQEVEVERRNRKGEAIKYRRATGRRVLDMEKVKEIGIGYLIRKVTPTKHGDSVEVHDALSALETLAKYHGLLKSDVTLHLPSDPSKLSDPELDAMIERLSGRRSSSN